jgi:hypothetical protein
MLGDEVLQLADEFAVPTERYIGLDSFFDGEGVEEVEPPSLTSNGVIVSHADEGGASPKCQCFAEEVGGLSRPFGAESEAPLLQQLLEAKGIDIFGADDQAIAGIHSHQYLRIGPVRLDGLSQLADGVVNDMRGRGWRTGLP